jgi:hypothetical protein
MVGGEGAGRGRITFRNETPSNMAQAVTLQSRGARLEHQFACRFSQPLDVSALRITLKRPGRFLLHHFQSIRHTHPTNRHYTCM